KDWDARPVGWVKPIMHSPPFTVWYELTIRRVGVGSRAGLGGDGLHPSYKDWDARPVGWVKPIMHSPPFPVWYELTIRRVGMGSRAGLGG
ncbi:hypothetical protein, partial [Phytopseudomonas daroniae]|uniref:hypothetical protein n=1 Tax=Phytopseudomonas daroniae TaxID=2487519 RepID=UPI0010EB730B